MSYLDSLDKPAIAIGPAQGAVDQGAVRILRLPIPPRGRAAKRSKWRPVIESLQPGECFEVASRQEAVNVLTLARRMGKSVTSRVLTGRICIWHVGPGETMKPD